MKNVRNYQKVSAFVKTFDEYRDDVARAMNLSEPDVYLDGTLGGEDISKEMAKYYGVSEITSIHSDGSEYNSIWIAYKEHGTVWVADKE